QEAAQGLAPPLRCSEELPEPFAFLGGVGAPRRLDADLTIQHDVVDAPLRLRLDMEGKDQQGRRREGFGFRAFNLEAQVKHASRSVADRKRAARRASRRSARSTPTPQN